VLPTYLGRSSTLRKFELHYLQSRPRSETLYYQGREMVRQLIINQYRLHLKHPDLRTCEARLSCPMLRQRGPPRVRSGATRGYPSPIKGEECEGTCLPGHDSGNVLCPPTGVDVGQTSLPSVQVSTSAPKFDSGVCDDRFCPQSQEGGQNSVPPSLLLSDLITLCRAAFRDASLALVAACGARILGSKIASTNQPRRGAG
jgi:hypothetical protein